MNNHIEWQSNIKDGFDIVIGNPPYNGESDNKGEWIMELMNDYKKEPEGKEKLKEKNSKWINDDYVKFLRYSQHLIEKNEEGILAFINPHGFLDNPTFRGMRWNLLKAYDKIYILNLHGNTKKKERSPDGSPDENVFDIQQGVSINIFIKTGKKKEKELAKVFHYDLYGKREVKYDFLWEKNITSIKYQEIKNVEPNYFFVQKDFQWQKKYNKGFSVNELFPINSVGIVTSRDNLVINKNKDKLNKKIKLFFEKDTNYIKNELNVKENSLWKIEMVKAKSNYNQSFIEEISYRPFDKQYIYFDTKNFLERSREKIMRNYLNKDNLGFLCTKSFKDENFSHLFVSNIISEAIFLSPQTGSNAMNFPLYIYLEESKQQSFEQEIERKPNLNLEIVNKIAEKLSLKFTNEKEENDETFAPIDILDYIYAVLHNPTYREKYKAFLKIDFPRVPYPRDQVTFWDLVKLGSELRQIHLLEKVNTKKYSVGYDGDSHNKITRKLDKNDFVIFDKENGLGKVYINKTQYFDNVPLVAWEFYIGGYQPAQKWLKDRKGRALDTNDIEHYQKMIVALSETDRIMKEIGYSLDEPRIEIKQMKLKFIDV